MLPIKACMSASFAWVGPTVPSQTSLCLVMGKCPQRDTHPMALQSKVGLASDMKKGSSKQWIVHRFLGITWLEFAENLLASLVYLFIIQSGSREYLEFIQYLPAWSVNLTVDYSLEYRKKLRIDSSGSSHYSLISRIIWSQKILLVSSSHF